MKKEFSENSRVQIPAILHLLKLGYKYISYKKHKKEFDPDTNIILTEFKKKFLEINKGKTDSDFSRELKDIKLELNYNDLGKSFFERLQGNRDTKLIDWENFDNNSFLVGMEVACKNNEDEFRPDITIFINGLPLSYIEVKKPNVIRDKTTGIKSEFLRFNRRLNNNKYRMFNNIMQIMSFSDNMEYADYDNQKMQGSYYSTTSLGKAFFNSMHEERNDELVYNLQDISDDDINNVLSDANKLIIKNTPEFKTNCEVNTNTNSFLSSIYSRKRFYFFLRFGIAYVRTIDKDNNAIWQKQIMRYPQYFATRKISEKIDSGIKKGIVWHTQGSGKTALAFFNIRYLKYKFGKKGVISNFYFVVDRLDLASQAKNEFEKRGLRVKLISKKSDMNVPFDEDVAVVNIQKINENTDLTNSSGYDLNTQNVYFIDEAHRSYNEVGSYLPNLYNSDRNAIKIALTGTPLINVDNKKNNHATTKEIFGDYIHKYYYNQSVNDGYTLRLIREEIETSYKEKLTDIYNDIKVKKGSLKKKDIYSNPNFVNPMLKYIINDFTESRKLYGDSSIGGMIVCQSSEQAREMFNEFKEKQKNNETKLSSALILSDYGDKKTRSDDVTRFKEGKLDFLIVYNMLLTGFDSPRLKKLYLGRKIKAHNLLQTLTRVNRPYKSFRMGFIVDFANISEEFDKTNNAYFKELNEEFSSLNDDEKNNMFGDLFVSQEEIEASLNDIYFEMSKYDMNNLEKFNNEINNIRDKKDLSKLDRVLQELKQYYNISRLMNYNKIVDNINKIDVSKMISIVENRISTINIIENVNDDDSSKILNSIMDESNFTFRKVSENELEIASNVFDKEKSRAASELNKNWDQSDPEWVYLYDEFMRILKKQDVSEKDLSDIDSNISELKKITYNIKLLNSNNNKYMTMFNDDVKFARTYKYFVNKKNDIYENVLDGHGFYILLTNVKKVIDEEVSKNSGIVSNKEYFEKETQRVVRKSGYIENVTIPITAVKEISNILTNEYLNELSEV
ncbi:DEAD/DEAH box helicase family protein [Apilactobacillus kunkeei]|uniref:DEAD/DEAH box helicase family protein n=1 Tax=Apilactobacillus kunkeei TaxID=148814 RepID=UPI00265A6E36|nr:DEAD/DEAH box helicase family protein [Apilactobacillus kunkeei]WJV42995.1 DEAD/DEAH box helicase family protein [Apilactobacillus kunkeei]